MAGYVVKQELELVDGEWQVTSSIDVLTTDMTADKSIEHYRTHIRARESYIRKLGEDEGVKQWKKVREETRKARIEDILENFKKEQEELFKKVKETVEKAED